MATKRRLTSLEAHTYEHVISRELGRLLVVVPPWAGWVLLLIMAAVLHLAWPGPLATWSIAAAGVLLAVLDLYLTHHRRGLGRWMAAATTLAAAAWLAAADAYGLNQATLGVWFIGGVSVAGAWSKWLHIHEADDEAGLSRIFETAAERAGQPGLRILRMERLKNRASATISHPPGVVTADVMKASGALESAARLPPGAITITHDMDRADRSEMVISDPRLLRLPLPWPGPSNAGASIADPVVLGRWQDGETVAVTVVNWHEHAMGCTGSGKTEGYAYSELAETVSRQDAGVVAIDITKGEQFLGPLRPALHELATGPEHAADLLRRFHRSIRARTDYLGRKGLPEWRPGCGLRHMTLWLEEAPDIFDMLEQLEEDAIHSWLIPGIRACRSAGWRVVFSLQRSDWTQMPTVIRGQLGKTCLGLLQSDDARWGLSAYQKEGDCHPELWGSDQPGMAYLDVPGVPRSRKTMPLRYWYWGADHTLISQHAAQFPASARPYDDVTAGVLVPGTAATARPATTLHGVPDPPDPEDDTMPPDDDDLGELADPAAYDGPDTPIAPERASKMTPEAAREVFREQIQAWAANGAAEFGIPQCAVVRDETGMSRPWLYTVLGEFEAAGLVRRVDTRTGARWRIERAA